MPKNEDKRMTSNKSPEMSDRFDSDDSDDGDLIIKVREKLKDHRKKTADDAFFVSLLSKYSVAASPSNESNRDLPFWGPGIHFSFNQISRELRVSAVLDPPHGPGPRSGIVRGDVVVRTSKTNVDYSQEPRTIFQEMLGEYGTKILVTFVRTSNVSYKFDVLLTRSYFNDQIVSSSMSNHGVLTITFVTGRNFQWDGPSACRVCALDGECQDPQTTEFASHDEEENARWNSNVYVPITDFKSQTITITVFSKSIVNSTATSDQASLKLRVPTLVSGWNETTDHWFNLYRLGQGTVVPSFSGFADEEGEESVPQVRLKLNWTSVANVEDLNLAIHNAKIKDRTRLERVRTLRAAAADSRRLMDSTFLGSVDGLGEEMEVNFTSMRPIFVYCRRANVKQLAQLLHHAPSRILHMRDEAGHTPLHIVCMNEDREARAMANLILEKDKSVVLLKDNLGQTPLHLACQNVGPATERSSQLSDTEAGNVLHLVRLILSINPEAVAVEDCDGLLPLDFAVHNPHKDAYKAVVELLSAKKDLSFAEILTIDLHAVWSKMSSWNISTLFGGFQSSHQHALLCHQLPDGVESIEKDSRYGRLAKFDSSNVSLFNTSTLTLAICFNAFASLTVDRKCRSVQGQVKDLQEATETTAKVIRIDHDFNISDQNQAVAHAFSSGLLSENISTSVLLSLSMAYPMLLPRIDQLGDAQTPSFHTCVTDQLDKDVKRMTYKVADALASFQRLPIHIACRNPSSHVHRVLPVLLEHQQDGASVPNWDRQLALHDACQNEVESVVEGRQRLPPLHFAAANSNPKAKEIVAMLLEQYPEGIYVTDGMKMRPIDYALRSKSKSAGKVVSLLLEADTESMWRLNKHGQSILHQAIISIFLSSTNTRMRLSSENRSKMLEIFFEYDEDSSGRLELPEIIQAIHQLGHDASDEQITRMVQEVDTDGNLELDFPEFINLIETYFISTHSDDPLEDSEFQMENLFKLTESIGNVSHHISVIEAILHHSAKIPFEQLPGLIKPYKLEPKCSPLAAIPDNFGRIPLFYAASSRASESEKVVKLLIDHFAAGLLWQDIGGDSSLHYAAAVQSVPSVRTIMLASSTRGVSPQLCRNALGKTPLELTHSLTIRSLLTRDRSRFLGSKRMKLFLSTTVLFFVLTLVLANSYLQYGVFYPVTFAAVLYGVGAFLSVVYFVYLHSANEELKRSEDIIVLFKRLELYSLMFPLLMLSVLAAIHIEHNRGQVSEYFWSLFLLLLFVASCSAVSLEISLLHAIPIPNFLRVLEALIVFILRFMEISSRVTIFGLVLFEYTICPCGSSSYKSLQDCYCYTNILTPLLLVFEALLQMYIWFGIENPSSKYKKDTLPPSSSREILRGFLNLLIIQKGRLVGTNFSRYFGYSRISSAAIVGEVLLPDVKLILIVRSILHFGLLLLLRVSDGTKELMVASKVPNLHLEAERSIFEMCIYFVAFSSVLQWIVLFARIWIWNRIISRTRVHESQEKSEDKGTAYDNASLKSLVNRRDPRSLKIIRSFRKETIMKKRGSISRFSDYSSVNGSWCSARNDSLRKSESSSFSDGLESYNVLVAMKKRHGIEEKNNPVPGRDAGSADVELDNKGQEGGTKAALKLNGHREDGEKEPSKSDGDGKIRDETEEEEMVKAGMEGMGEARKVLGLNVAGEDLEQNLSNNTSYHDDEIQPAATPAAAAAEEEDAEGEEEKLMPPGLNGLEDSDGVIGIGSRKEEPGEDKPEAPAAARQPRGRRSAVPKKRGEKRLGNSGTANDVFHGEATAMKLNSVEERVGRGNGVPKRKQVRKAGSSSAFSPLEPNRSKQEPPAQDDEESSTLLKTVTRAKHSHSRRSRGNKVDPKVIPFISQTPSLRVQRILHPDVTELGDSPASGPSTSRVVERRSSLLGEAAGTMNGTADLVLAVVGNGGAKLKASADGKEILPDRAGSTAQGHRSLTRDISRRRKKLLEMFPESSFVRSVVSKGNNLDPSVPKTKYYMLA
ncbi:hypothetical protein GUITHDRAFT_103018 [Guillardia theta CCMP2712]|uniref:EF-hand domain-containing protein n=1 Tax=Guillardia theta (strain CCMP2712) TaxID=905079 RepID=L1JS11_GUITC|nr:hypothetical protein GUITHDRAFT_103018 [Guillardia theta CCMP2712]EKX51099.1 hypothetical protein GUITHDRAFT_103018 [Guillardia theta CCMP2712]|eukprot:XP_005838079.1 hypothetical protein GUITHDRAFT_103018 [Guillardia theta CCMP2712]